MEKLIQKHIEESYKTKIKILEDEKLIDIIKQVAQITIEAYKKGNKTLIAGNGGSAADAQHMAGEFVSRFYFDRPGLASLALTTDTSILTAIGNDYGYERVFARQIQAQGNQGDIFFGISTSGNSPNIIAAIEECKKKGIFTVGLVGGNICKMDEICDYIIKVPSSETPRIQESHILIEHMICALVEQAIFREEV